MTMYAYFNTPRFSLFYILCFTLIIGGCKPSPTSTSENLSDNSSKDSKTYFTDAEKTKAHLISKNIWRRGEEKLNQLQLDVKKLNKNTLAFLINPNADLFSELNDQWQKTLNAYYIFSPYLSIKHSAVSSELNRWQSYLAAWPILPGYLDSVGVYTHSGIVNDIALSLSVESLRKQHQLTDAEEVTLGLYAIQFILNSNAQEKRAIKNENENNEPEQKEEDALTLNNSYLRFIEATEKPEALSKSDIQINELPNNRRRTLLKLQVQILLSDINNLSQEWGNRGGLKTRFFQINSGERILAFYKGLLSDLDEIKLSIDKTSNIENTNVVALDLADEEQKNNVTLDLLNEDPLNKNVLNTVSLNKGTLNLLSARLLEIDYLCCKQIESQSDRDEKKENLKSSSALSDLLSDIDRKQLLSKIYDIKKQLNEN